MKPESFSRALRQLRGTGVSVKREFVRIDEVAHLSAFVEGDEPDGVPCRLVRTPAQCGAFDLGCPGTAYAGSLRAAASVIGKHSLSTVFDSAQHGGSRLGAACDLKKQQRHLLEHGAVLLAFGHLIEFREQRQNRGDTFFVIACVGETLAR